MEFASRNVEGRGLCHDFPFVFLIFREESRTPGHQPGVSVPTYSTTPTRQKLVQFWKARANRRARGFARPTGDNHKWHRLRTMPWVDSKDGRGNHTTLTCRMRGPELSLVAILTRSAREFAVLFCITCARCAFSVILLMPSSSPTCLFNRPETTNAMTCRSRREMRNSSRVAVTPLRG